jgi:hypothetical protein
VPWLVIPLRDRPRSAVPTVDNADLSRQLQEQKALADGRQAQRAERKTLLDVIAQSTTTLKGMET